MDKDRRQINRRDFIKTTAVGTAAAGVLGSRALAGESSAARAKQPNILFIMSDQQRSTALSCADNRVVKTPNIDELASKGVRFTNGYVNCPQCCPNRASLYNGRYISTHRVRWNNVPYPDSETDNTIAAVLKRKGYKTACFGKMHITGKNGFDLGYGDKREDNYQLGDYHAEIQAAGRPNPIAQAYKNPYWTGKIDMPAEDYIENIITNKALAFMEKNRKKPFFVWLSFHGPHPPYAAPKPYCDMYNPADIPAPPKPPAGVIDDPRILHKRQKPTAQDKTIMTDEKWKELAAQYYGLCTLIDDNVGKAVKKVEELGLENDTIIVYTSDHGDDLGDHGLFSKGRYCYEGNTKVPFIIHVPGMKTADKVIPALAQSIDLMPTLLELAGAPVPPGVQGKSLVPVLSGGAEEVNDAVYSEIGPDENRKVNMVRMGDYKYVYYTKDATEELFDLENDPHEFTNLARKKEHKDALDKMRMKMIDWKIRSEDPLPLELR
ncbi:sulfatase-like hydrolase/transferase [Candidatus Hydrogenedentota bacterium]